MNRRHCWTTEARACLTGYTAELNLNVYENKKEKLIPFIQRKKQAREKDSQYFTVEISRVGIKFPLSGNQLTYWAGEI